MVQWNLADLTMVEDLEGKPLRVRLAIAYQSQLEVVGVVKQRKHPALEGEVNQIAERLPAVDIEEHQLTGRGGEALEQGGDQFRDHHGRIDRRLKSEHRRHLVHCARPLQFFQLPLHLLG